MKLEISIKPELLTMIGPFPLTNSQLTSWLCLLLLVGAAIIVGNNYKRLPTGLQHVFEMAYESFTTMAEEAMGKFGRKFVPFVVSAFLFITLSNWVGVLPGVGSLVKIEDREKAIAEHIIPLGSGGAAHSADTHAAGDKSKDAKAGDHKEEAHHAFVPVFRGGNADLNSTLALAIIAQVLVHVMGVKTAGIKHHLAHFKNPIEIVTEISKVLSFGFRLFGNVFAGEVLLTVMGGLLAILTRNYFLPFGVLGGLIAVPFLALEFFVGAIQGLVFAMLVIGFLSVFVKTDQSPAHH